MLLYSGTVVRIRSAPAVEVAVSMQARRTAVFPIVAILLLAGCPLPYQYNGAGVVPQGGAIDPSSPSLTARVQIEYTSDADEAGTVGHQGSSTTTGDTELALTTETENAVIYYTTDGTAPDPRSPETRQFDFASPISLRLADPTAAESSAMLQVRAVAIGPNMKPSLETAATVTVQYPQAQAPVITPEGGVYLTDQSVTMTTATEGASIYYTVDPAGGEASRPVPGDAGTAEYTGAIELTGPANTFTIAAIAVAEQMLDSATTLAQYTIDYDGLANPTFNPPGGFYDGAQNVTIASSSGATIWYTTDGSDPVIGTSASFDSPGVVVVDRSMTLKAVATAPQRDPSGVVSAQYDLQAATPSFSPSGGTYFNQTEVTITSASSGAIIWFTTDGTAPVAGGGGSTQSAASPATLTVDSATQIRALATAGLLDTSAESSASYAFEVAPIVVGSVPQSPFISTVTLATDTIGAAIYYTDDDTDPSDPGNPNRTPYTGAFEASLPVTIKAVGEKAGYNDSAITTEVLTIGSGVYDDFEDGIINPSLWEEYVAFGGRVDEEDQFQQSDLSWTASPGSISVYGYKEIPGGVQTGLGRLTSVYAASQWQFDVVDQYMAESSGGTQGWYINVVDPIDGEFQYMVMNNRNSEAAVDYNDTAGSYTLTKIGNDLRVEKNGSELRTIAAPDLGPTFKVKIVANNVYGDGQKSAINLDDFVVTP